jgi:hypothetical protein
MYQPKLYLKPQNAEVKLVLEILWDYQATFIFRTFYPLEPFIKLLCSSP